MKLWIPILLLNLSIFSNYKAAAQCTEAKDPDMAKYLEKTKTQDAQGCSQCGMLAFYFCSARNTITVEDKRKVASLITATKRNIINMGQPYCCPELVNREPQWGVDAKAGNAATIGNQINNPSGTNSNSNLTSAPPSNAEKLFNNISSQIGSNQAYMANKDASGMEKKAEASLIDYQINQAITGKADLGLASVAVVDAISSTILSAKVNSEKFEELRPHLEKWNIEVSKVIQSYIKLEENINFVIQPLNSLKVISNNNWEIINFSLNQGYQKNRGTVKSIIKIGPEGSKLVKVQNDNEIQIYGKDVIQINDDDKGGFVIMDEKSMKLTTISSIDNEVIEKAKEIAKKNDKLKFIHKAGPIFLAHSGMNGNYNKVKDLSFYSYNNLSEIKFDFNFGDYEIPYQDLSNFYTYNAELITFTLTSKNYIPVYVSFYPSGGKPVSVLSMKDFYPKPSNLLSSAAYIYNIGNLYKIPNYSFGKYSLAAVNSDHVFKSFNVQEGVEINKVKKGTGNSYLLEIDHSQGKVIRMIGEVGSRILGMTLTHDKKFLFVLRGSLDYRLELYDFQTSKLIGSTPIMVPKFDFKKSTGELSREKNCPIAYLKLNLAGDELLVVLEPEINITKKVSDDAGKILVIDLIPLLSSMTNQKGKEVSAQATTPSKSNNENSIADEIKKLKELLDSNTITKEEFEAAKRKILNN